MPIVAVVDQRYGWCRFTALLLERILRFNISTPRLNAMASRYTLSEPHVERFGDQSHANEQKKAKREHFHRRMLFPRNG
jgi:hypothetical protein